MDPYADRPPSEVDQPAPRGAGPGTGTGPITRADRMRAQIDALARAGEAARQRVDALSVPGPAETPPADSFGAISDADKLAATQARRLREQALATAKLQADRIDAAARALETDLANDPDPKAAAAARTGVATDANEPYIVTRNPDGSLKTEPNPNYQAKPEAAGAPPTLDLGPARPGQRTDMALIEQQADAYARDLWANKNLTPAQRNKMYNDYLETTVKPARAQAIAEINAEADRAAARQREADARAGRAEDRALTTEERIARTSEQQLGLNRAQFAYGGGKDAVANALALLPYRANPGYAQDLAATLEGIRTGSGAGGFRPESFLVDLPDLDALHAQGAARAEALYQATAGQAFTPPPPRVGAPAPPAGVPPMAGAGAITSSSGATLGLPASPVAPPPPAQPPPWWDPNSAGGPGSSPYY